MVVNRGKKVNKYRAHTTHGGGHRKKRRGAGSRGGRGRAGTGKRAGHKRIGVIMGTKGFKPRRDSKKIKVTNLAYFTLENLNSFESKGLVTKEGDMFVVDLAKLGFQKVLGTGKVGAKLKIIAQSYSATAAKKVEAAGGEIVSSGPSEKSVSEKSVPKKSVSEEEKAEEPTSEESS